MLRRATGGQFIEIAQLPPDAMSYSDLGAGGAGLTPGESYDYHVQAFNVAGYSDFTGLSVTTSAMLYAPSNLSAIAGRRPHHLDLVTGQRGGELRLYRSDTSGANPTLPLAAAFRQTVTSI